jgi:hypothetical protein
LSNVKQLDTARLRRVFALAIDTFTQLIPKVSCPERRQRLERKLEKTKQKMEGMACPD